MIRNAQELADHIGANDATEASLSRRLYKNTDCGAWLALVDVKRGGKARKEKWQVFARLGIGGRVYFIARRNSRGVWLTAKKMPEHLRSYLLLDNGLNMVFGESTFSDWTDFVAAVCSSEDCKVQKRARAGKFAIQFLLSVEGKGPSSTRPGAKIGSIVEGSDRCAESVTLVFPFTAKEWREAVQSVEDEVDEIWKATHGCETCGKHWEEEYGTSEDEFGDTPVWAECPDCGGDGTII
jgi:hypothetical protein